VVDVVGVVTLDEGCLVGAVALGVGV